jgi:tetratricopeptide (TPR) repeat protein
MFGIFGRKPTKSVDDDLIPELKRQVVQIKDSTGVSYLAIAEPMLTFGVTLLLHEKGAAGLAQVINNLSSMIQEQQAALGSLGSSIMEIKIPEHSRDHYHTVIDKMGDFGTRFIQKGYSYEEVGAAMASVSGDIAKLIDKDNILYIGLLRKELARRRDDYRREQFRQTASGEHCSDESINTLLRAEANGFTLRIGPDRTFVLSKGSSSVHYLRSNFDIGRFGRTLKQQEETDQANRSPVETLVAQGQKHLQEQNLQGAINAFSAALRIEPDSRDIHFHRGVAWSNSYYNKGNKPTDLQNAIDDYTRSIDLDPEFATAYFQRAGLSSKQGQVEGAIADYSKAIEKQHNTSSAYYCRGLLWQSTGEAGKVKAIADFDGAVRTGSKSDQFMALMARAEVHHELGNLDTALADLNAAAAYYPKGPPGLYEKRANILVDLGRAQEAVADFSKGIEVVSPLASPTFVAKMYEKRGQCRMLLGETQLAHQDLERAAQLLRQRA